MINRKRALPGLLLLVAAGCSPPADGGGHDVAGVRGGRYCEVLVGKLDAGVVHIQVFNTWGLDDCPAATWDALDASQLKSDLAADVVVLNGPRYWTMDAFTDTSALDPTPRTIGGLPMREAGALDVTLAQAASGGQPYLDRSVRRDTTWVFDAGAPVYELVDPTGRVFDMQSYSVQKVAQSADTLATLGARLTLPAGWSFRTRTLGAPLEVTAVAGVATIVQDDLENTYQLSQQ